MEPERELLLNLKKQAEVTTWHVLILIHYAYRDILFHKFIHRNN